MNINQIQNLNTINALSNIVGSNMVDSNGTSNSDIFNLVMMNLLKASANNENTTKGYCNCQNDLINNDLLINNSIHNLVSKVNDFSNTNTNYIYGVDGTTNININTKDKVLNLRIENAIENASKKYNVDQDLIKTIIKIESNFNPNVESYAGAKGLMQLMPANIKEYGVTDPFDVEQNIDAGTAHIKEYLNMFDGDLDMAIIAYNFGPGNMKKRGIKSLDDLYKAPKETQNYIAKLNKNYNRKTNNLQFL